MMVSRDFITTATPMNSLARSYSLPGTLSRYVPRKMMRSPMREESISIISSTSTRHLRMRRALISG